jgi:hypothetical protein
MGGMEKGRVKGWQAIVLAALVIPLLYVLSSGPSALLFGKNDTGNAVWNVIYWPLLRAAESAGLLDDLLWYCHWWVNLPNP